MSGFRRGFACALACAGVSGWLGLAPVGARADDGTAVDQIVAILQQKGLIDQDTGDQILAKQARSEASHAAEKPTPSVAQALTDGLIWSGDLRLRDEQFWYDTSPIGPDTTDDNNRIRYRARVGFTKQVSPWALIGVRIVSDTTDYRSTNVSAGQNSNFSYDSIFLDRAYATFFLPDPGDVGLKTTFTVGKFTNPFLWKNGLDRIVWDDDIAPEGLALTTNYTPTENSKLWATFGYFVELQNATAVDPRIFGYQLGGSIKPTEGLETGLRATYYNFQHLANDSAFFSGSASNGNLSNAFTPDMDVVETSAFASWAGFGDWPMLVWGTWAQNLEARGGNVIPAGLTTPFHVGAENTAWGFGVEAGDPKKLVRLGVGYNHVEANAVSALYTDSDMFDGKTNRRGWTIYGFREIAPNIEARLWLWEGTPIKTTASGTGEGPFDISDGTDSQANFYRMQADMNFKF